MELDLYEKFYLEVLIQENEKEVLEEIEFIERAEKETNKTYYTIRKHLNKQLETMENLKRKLKL